jgi:hypothetical protein
MTQIVAKLFVASRGERSRGGLRSRLRLTITVAAERLPEVNRAALVGLPGVVLWDLEKP